MTSQTPVANAETSSSVINYQLVWIYTGHFERCPALEGPLGIGHDHLQVTAYPPDDNDHEIHQAQDHMLYSYGDRNKWTPFLACSWGSGSVDNPHKFEMKIEQSIYEEDIGENTVIDDNFNKMLFLKGVGRGLQGRDSWIWHFKRIVPGKQTVLTEGEKNTTWIMSGWGV